ncbi:MAG: non-canonical purine NTP pyrophosphatase, RdgB/HAM1 family [Cytophagia bacterium]|jgi:XTP/dITP diphosphohydrolase|nr:non-canonical purine NTP pyrophosphatase, RdgB/HAM1 family [Cytophagia bacterium]
MNKICFVTGNKNKLREVQKLLFSYHLLSLDDINFTDEILETEDTIEANAFLKANHIHKKFKINCFSDDTGLFIDALDGQPGVKSARFAGVDSNSEDNIRLVLKKLDGEENRIAVFKTVICLIVSGNVHYFDGEVKGQISKEKAGDRGFGYDPIFIPEGFNKTFSEFTLEEKNKLSHRAIAVDKLVNFLNGYE